MIDCVWMGGPPEGPWEPGWAMWARDEHLLSDHYKAEVRAVRRPISVQFPTRGGGSVSFIIDCHPTEEPAGAWKVDVDLASLIVGQRPDITVHPSINIDGLYHGYLQHGQIGDDIPPPSPEEPGPDA